VKAALVYVGIVILAVAVAFAVGVPLLRPPKKIIYAKPRAAGPTTVVSRVRKTHTLYLASPSKLAASEVSQTPPTLIMRELVRQALLVAARDGLGMYTRDGVLREPVPDRDMRDGALRLDVGFRQGPVIPVSVFEDGARGVKIYNQDVRLAGNVDHPDLIKLVEEVEGLSRVRYVQLLKDAGFSAVAAATQGAKSSEGETADLGKARERLDELTEVSQFAAIRAGHTALRAGSSKAALGVLVRGYANLAQLTRAEWSPATDVYAARSLLYAQRMVATDPKDAFARWHRAYALAMFGEHRQALQEVGEARKLGKQPDAPPAPAWGELLELLCRYQTGKLIKAAGENKAVAPLSLFMAFLTAENCGSDTYSIEIAGKALEANPKCARIIEAICEKSGVAYLHKWTEMGPAVHEAALANEMGELGMLPKNVEGTVAQLRQSGPQPVVAAVVGAELVKSQEEAEPSWAAVGRTLQEIDFYQVRRRAEFMAQWWGVDTSEFVRQATPLVAEHPYFPLIKAYGLYTGRQPGAFEVYQTLGPMEFVDPRVNIGRAVQLTQIMDDNNRLIGEVAWRRALQDMDLTAYDIEPTLPVNHPDQLRSDRYGPLRRAWQARFASPFNALAKAAYVLLSWNEAEKSLDLWTKREHPDHPAIFGALGRKYAELKEYDKSEKNWLAYLKIAHDGPAYRELADVNLKDGKEDKWLATLEESLKFEDYGLEHSITNEKIARHYIETKAFEKAKLYADAAAQSGSEASMRLAIECYEGLKQWDVAEKFVREEMDRYRQPLGWMVWCKRTGHGDLAAATAMAKQHLQTIAGQTNSNALGAMAMVALLENDLPGAAAPLRMEFDADEGPWAGVHLGLIYVEQGKKDVAKEVLQKAAVAGNGYIGQRHLAVVAQYMASALPPDSVRFSVTDIHFAADSLLERQQVEVWYVVGKFLKVQGRKEEAVECLKRAAVGTSDRLDAVLAIQELRGMGEMAGEF
jgi:tetratricopeptide (TPR) repeat protein